MHARCIVLISKPIKMSTNSVTNMSYLLPELFFLFLFSLFSLFLEADLFIHCALEFQSIEDTILDLHLKRKKKFFNKSLSSHQATLHVLPYILLYSLHLYKGRGKISKYRYNKNEFFYDFGK